MPTMTGLVPAGGEEVSAQAVMASWVTSKGHRKNLMHRKARDIGIGIARKNGRLYWAMVLAAPR